MEGAGKVGDGNGGGVAALLLAMEERLSNKLDANKRAVNEAVKLSKLNSDALDTLEEKVDATDEMLKETLAKVEAQEERALACVENQVKEMVREQLKVAGFDTQLSAGNLSMVNGNTSKGGSYATAPSKTVGQISTLQNLDKDQRCKNNSDNVGGP